MTQPLPLLDWQEGAGRSYHAAHAGLALTVYYGTAAGGRWWASVELEEPVTFGGNAEVEELGVELKRGFRTAMEAQMAAEGLAERVGEWLEKREGEADAG